MKKRITCLLLALAMICSLIPAGIITASAAGLSVSEAGIKVIKSYIGFHGTAYETYSGSGVYLIGYGTSGVAKETITEANADKELRAELKEICTRINAFCTSESVVLVQKRYDALVWFSYVYDTACNYLTTGNLGIAVKYDYTGSDFVNTMVHDIFGSALDDTAANRAIITSCLAMANLYLNGSYSATSTGSLGYTFFDANGGAFAGNKTKTVQAFDGKEATEISVVNPTYSGHTFLGWYSGNTLVTGLSSSTNGATLYARWQEGATPVSCSYTIPGYVIYEAAGLSDTDTCNVYQYYDGAVQIDTVARDAKVTIVSEVVSGGFKWISPSTGGWIKLCAESDIGSMPVLINATTVTMINDIVYLRKSASFTAEKTATAYRGQTRTIVMTDSSGSWGYCSDGWIYLPYTNYKGNTAAGTASATGTSGTISCNTSVNIRSAAGVGNTLVTTLKNGTAVTVYETTTVDGAQWGRIDQGWVAMQYVTLSQSATAGSTVSVGSTVYVSSSVNLNVRSGPGTQYSKVAYLTPGASAVIYQKQVVNGVTWGLTDLGWINMSYVTGSVSTSSGTTVYGIGGTVVNCSTAVNVRSAAGTTNALVGTVKLGSRVTVTERVQVNGYYWGHISTGWVCMEYIQLDSEWKDPTSTAETVKDTVTVFAGYPARTVAANVNLYASASSDSKVLAKLANDACFTIQSFQTVGTKTFGKITFNGTTGYVDMDAAYIKMDAFNAKVTASTAPAYEEPSTRATYYAALVKGTSVTVAAGSFTKAGGWVLDNGTLWGKVEVSGHSCWINLANVTMYLNNTVPSGITTLSGSGYVTGTVNADTALYKDDDGDVSTDTTIYELVADQKVNVTARQLVGTVTYGKVTVGSVTGWVDMAYIDLDSVEMKTTAKISIYSSAADAEARTPCGTLDAGTAIAVVDRTLVKLSGIVQQVNDIGEIVVKDGDNAGGTFFIILDEGGLSYTTTAASTAANPNIAISVAVSGQAKVDMSVYEEVDAASKVLLTIKKDTYLTVMNWMNDGGITWGKVQVGSIVGWVDTSNIDFDALTGTVTNTSINLYVNPDKGSSVQILECKGQTLELDDLTFDGTTVWAKVTIASYTGWVDLSTVTLNTSGAYNEAEEVITGPTIATATTNSHNIQVQIGNTPGAAATTEISSIAKGTSLSFLKLGITGGKYYWYANFGDNDYLPDSHDKNGWIESSYVTMNSTVATVSESSLEVYADLTLGDTIYTLYRGEQATIREFAMANDGKSLCGEIAVNNDTGWIVLAVASSDPAAPTMNVSLTPGAVSTSYGTSATSATAAASTTTTSTGVPGYIVCSSYVNVRSAAGTSNALKTQLANGTSVTVYEQTTVDGALWARIDQGWVAMEYVRLGTATTTTATATTSTSGSSTVSIVTTVPSGAIAVGYTTQQVAIYGGPGYGYGSSATVGKNVNLTIYEIRLDGGVSWGRTDSGWVIVSYMVITGIGSSSNATVARCGFTANVRYTADYNGAVMAKVMISSRVYVYETKTVGSETWARTDLGWVSTTYLVLDSDTATAAAIGATTSTTDTTSTVATGSTEEVG